MNTRLLHIFTRTPLHVGTGSSVGAIDMPIQRERHTQIPIIPGSGLKGVLRDLWPAKAAETLELFGSEPAEQPLRIGNLVVGEARAVCFPVRSAKGAFAWLTSPLALARYARDAGQAAPDLPAVAEDACLAGPGVTLDGGKVVLEEYAFSAQPLPDAAVALLAGAVPGDGLWNTLKDRLVILSDGLFAHFCATACEVQQRVRIDDETGTVARGGLFNQENVPSETLFYAVMAERDSAKPGLKDLMRRLEEKKVLQIGGDETIGLGFCTVAFAGGAS
jgi:CRISPR-associated protein Cmr4